MYTHSPCLLNTDINCDHMKRNNDDLYNWNSKSFTNHRKIAWWWSRDGKRERERVVGHVTQIIKTTEAETEEKEEQDWQRRTHFY